MSSHKQMGNFSRNNRAKVSRVFFTKWVCYLFSVSALSFIWLLQISQAMTLLVLTPLSMPFPMDAHDHVACWWSTFDHQATLPERPQSLHMPDQLRQMSLHHVMVFLPSYVLDISCLGTLMQLISTNNNFAYKAHSSPDVLLQKSFGMRHFPLASHLHMTRYASICGHSHQCVCILLRCFLHSLLILSPLSDC